MDKNKMIQLSKKVVDSKVLDKIPAADVLTFFKSIVEAYKEDQITKREIAKIDATKEVLLTEIKERYTLYHKVFDAIFEERKDVIDKYFDIIDKGVASNNNDVVLQGLVGLSKIVTTSPFTDINTLSNLLESRKSAKSSPIIR